jgi:hypothetical protein
MPAGSSGKLTGFGTWFAVCSLRATVNTSWCCCCTAGRGKALRLRYPESAQPDMHGFGSGCARCPVVWCLHVHGLVWAVCPAHSLNVGSRLLQ